MGARDYRRGPATQSRTVLAAYLFGGLALALLLLGLVLDALPEHGVGEWNGLPLGEYGTGDVWFGVVVLGVCGAVCAAVALARGKIRSQWVRRVMIGVLVAGAVALGVTVLGILLVLSLCGSGACD
jgi:hypothetical protein